MSEADDDSSEECSNESDVVDNDEKKGPERNYEINPQQQRYIVTVPLILWSMPHYWSFGDWLFGYEMIIGITIFIFQ